VNDTYDDLDELPAPPRRDIPDADRELLELAARAIGAVRFEEVEGEQWVNLHFADGSVVYGWNPLVHSDDTLNLAVSISACVVVDNDMRWCGVHLNGNRGKYDLVEQFENDAAAATRRAVTRAAAEIGKQSR
jgi:hypothetical protein